MSDSVERKEGARFAGYELVRRVSDGRFSEVWRALDPTPSIDAAEPGGSSCAIKFATTDLGARMLRAEADLTWKLAHVPGVPRVLRFEDGERPWLVLPWIGDSTFRDTLDAIRSEDDRARAVKQFLEVVETVTRVHDRGWAHGDLKPENIVIGPFGKPFLLDFGLAHEIRQERLDSRLGSSMKTDDSVAGGTLAYLPPEAVKGAEPALPGDVYALGVMLHEIVLGRRPDKAVSPENLKRLIDEDTLDLLLAALAFDPRDRLKDARAFRQKLAALGPALTATGGRRRMRALRRYVLAGLAAFFVALRYASVAALLASYVAMLWATVFVHAATAIFFLGALALHVVIRWEGPETPEEAQLRRGGIVVGPSPAVTALVGRPDPGQGPGTRARS